MSLSAVSREELYDLVWSEPMTKVAKRYEISSSFLARVCTRLNVPRPARGYWAKLAVGKMEKKAPLPGARPGDEAEWVRGASASVDVRRRRSKPIRPVLPTPLVATEPNPVARPRRRGPHPLVAEAEPFFVGSKEAESGHLRPAKRRLVDVYVSNGALKRALGIANKLFLALEAKGHHVTFAPLNQQLGRPSVDDRLDGPRDNYESAKWGPDRPTVVYIGTLAIGLTLFEVSQDAEMRYFEGKFVPLKQLPLSERLSRNPWTSSTTKRPYASGKLCLRASSPYTVADWERLWHEMKRGELTSWIPQIVTDLEADAATIAKLVEEGQRRVEEQRAEFARQQERWRREEEERQRAKHLKESRDQLAEIIAAWAKAKEVEDFFEDVERRATSLAEDQAQLLMDRINQARRLLGGADGLNRLAAWKTPDERGQDAARVQPPEARRWT